MANKTHTKYFHEQQELIGRNTQQLREGLQDYWRIKMITISNETKPSFTVPKSRLEVQKELGMD